MLTSGSIISFHTNFLHVILPSKDSCVSESFSVRLKVLIRSSSAVAPLWALTAKSFFRACIPWMTQKPNRLHKSLHLLCLPTPRLCSCIKIHPVLLHLPSSVGFAFFVPLSRSIRSHCMCTFWVPGPLLGIRGCYQILLGCFFYFFSPCLLPFFLASPFPFPKVPVAGGIVLLYYLRPTIKGSWD